METHLSPEFAATPDGKAAENILRKCVHCGFCQATCPSYQVLGNELDSPRGRIYLIKEMLEGGEVTAKTQQHLDQCLTCRNCETTCPSGVAYGDLIDIGRKVASEKVRRPLTQRLTRKALAYGLTSPLVKPAFALGRLVKPILPSVLAKKLPTTRAAGALPTAQHAKRVIMPAGCVQPAMMPSIDAATLRVLDKLGFSAVNPPASGCCGALRLHLDEFASSHAQMQRNIDAWYPLLKSGEAQAVIMNASGCGATVAEYGKHFANDAAYAEKAKFVSEKTMDIGAFLAQETLALSALLAQLPPTPAAESLENAVFHSPCTLQHWQKLRPVVEGVLRKCGVSLKPFADSHLCCGSAGAYSVLQPKIATELRDKKLSHIAAATPSVILSANIGCITHLASGTATPVLHWVEWLDKKLSAQNAKGT